MTTAKLREKGQVTLPPNVRAALGVNEGDQIEFEIGAGGIVTMTGLKLIPADQAWFWTESWQAGEREASEEIAAGRGTVHETAEDFLNSLEG